MQKIKLNYKALDLLRQAKGEKKEKKYRASSSSVGGLP